MRHDFLGLAENEMGNFRESLVSGGEQWAARDQDFAGGAAAPHDFAHRLLMHDHRAEQDVIGPAEVGLVEAIDIQVDELEFPGAGEHGRDREQAEGREGRFFGDEPQNMLEAPERVWSLRTNEQDLHATGHGRVVHVSGDRSR